MSSSSEPGYTPPDTTLLGEDHIRAYEESNGEVGHEWNGATCLLLTVTGRKTGDKHRYALIYDKDGDNHVVVASMGGAPDHPQWYKNLVENPEVDVQVMDRKFKARARTAEGEERERLWQLMNVNWPNYDVYATRTDRKIPVVVLEPV